MKKNYMRAGDLKDRVVLERKSIVKLPNADISTTWNPLLTTWAKVIIMSGAQQQRAGKTESENRIELSMRYREDIYIETGDRVTWRGRKWIVETGLVVDPERTKISMTAVVDFESTKMS